jgi:hypothetical protein
MRLQRYFTCLAYEHRPRRNFKKGTLQQEMKRMSTKKACIQHEQDTQASIMKSNTESRHGAINSYGFIAQLCAFQ